jgi:hypothetical protein
MIKNILYSLFIHFILFAVIYYGLTKKNIKEIETDQEVLVSIANLDTKGVPPINEIIKKTPPEEKKPQIEESKKIISDEKNIQKDASTELQKSSPENILKKTPDPIKTKPEKQTTEKKPTTQKIDDKKSIESKNTKNSDTEFFDMMNLKVFKNITQDNQGANLSARETINIQSQLKLCYKRAIEESGFESKNKVVIKLQISREGYIENDLDEMIDLEKYNNPDFKDYKIVIDNIKRALDLCSPLRNLPADKYESWKEIILQFDINDSKKN